MTLIFDTLFVAKSFYRNVITNRETRGYVLEEAPQWKVQLTNNNSVYITPPVYDHDYNMWMFQSHVY